jgi:hypothetical protein
MRGETEMTIKSEPEDGSIPTVIAAAMTSPDHWHFVWTSSSRSKRF